MAVKAAPANAMVLGTVAGALTLLGGDLGETARLLDRAEALNPHSPMTAFHRGWLSVRRGEAAPAFAAFERMLAAGLQTPLAPYGLAGRAASRLLVGSIDEAEVDLAAAADLHAGEGHPCISVWQAVARAMAGDVAGSRALAKRYRLREEQLRAMMPADLADRFLRDILD